MKTDRSEEHLVRQRLDLVMRVAREVMTGLEMPGVLRRALALGVRAVEATAGSLALLDEAGEAETGLLFLGSHFQPADMDLIRESLEEGVMGETARRCEPALIPDIAQAPKWPAGLFPAPRTGSALCIPLLLRDRLVGLLTLTHPQPGFFDQEDVETLSLVGEQLAVALESGRLFATEEQRRRIADVLSEIVRTLTATLDLDQVLDLILEQLARVIRYDSAAIFLLQGKRLFIRAWRGLPDEEIIRGLAFELESDHIMARAIAQRDPIVCVDVQEEEGWENVEGVPPIRGWIAAPLVARDEVVGVLTVDSLQRGRYSQEDARVVAAFADHAAIAVANARLWHEIRQRLDEVAFLHATGKMLTASLELDRVLFSILDSLRQHFDVEAASVALVEQETGDLVFRVASGAAAEEVEGLRLKPGEGIAGWVITNCQPALVGDVQRDKRFYRGIDESSDFRTQAMIAVPIMLGQEAIGVIEVLNPRGKRPLGEDDVNLLMNVAALAASAIQNARHFQRAREAEERYTSLFENSADPIIITDESGRILNVNRKLVQTLGWQEEDVVGREVETLFEEPETVAEQLDRAVRGEEVLCTVQARRREGEPCPFEMHASRILIGSRHLIQWTCHDLTERVELERVRQELTHMIIHDLRTPLSTILSSLELIHTAFTDQTITVPMEQLFAIARRGGDRLYLLIDSILDLARLRSGKDVLEYGAVDIRRMVKEAVEQIRPAAAARNHRLTCHLPPSLPTLWGDGPLLQRVLLNLLDNAVKFTPPGGEVSIAVELADEQNILFSVSDTGPGIPPEHLDRIFDEFARAQSEVKGTGLGLALCRLGVEAHSGHIWVESEPGEGSTFRFILPLGEEE